MFKNLSVRSCKISFSYKISTASGSKKELLELSKIRTINRHWYLSIVEKGIRREICQSINIYAKANNKYMKEYDKNEESSCLKYWDVSNLYDWAMSQKLQVNDFQLVEDISGFNGNLKKSYNYENDEESFLSSQWFIIFAWKNENWKSWKYNEKVIYIIKVNTVECLIKGVRWGAGG